VSWESIAELINMAEKSGQSLGATALAREAEDQGAPAQELMAQMISYLAVMEDAVHRGLAEPIRSERGVGRGQAPKLARYAETCTTLSGRETILVAAMATAVMEVNAGMGRIVAAPTAGSSGILPAVVVSVSERLQLQREQVALALFAAGAVGMVIANHAGISGAEGGCQAEVGSAAAMAAAAAVEMAGGTPRQAGAAVALMLKNVLGLVCDPVAGLVEVPCIKRNGMYAAMAILAADMALAGVDSIIPADEVITAMAEVGRTIPVALRETAQGGLAATPTGQRLMAKLQGQGVGVGGSTAAGVAPLLG